MAIVELNDIQKSYKTGDSELQVLRGISSTFQSGETVAIIGESGCGKSTLLNIIGGLDNPTGGDVHSCGFNINKMSEKELTNYRNLELGFVFQFHFLLKDFSSLENIMIPALMSGVNKNIAKELAQELIEKVGLIDRKNHYPSQLSGGERQRIALARALINNPQLILADEPTGNLDEKNSRVVEDLLFNLVEEKKSTLLMVTHDSRLAEKCDRIFKLTEGKVNLQ